MKVYHYTTLACACAVIRIGYLLPPVREWAPDDASIVWFSRAADWEPTASRFVTSDGTVHPWWAAAFKSLISDGASRAMNFAEIAASGAARFAISSRHLLRWKDLECLAPMLPQTRWLHEEVARERGSNPRHWFGSTAPVPIYNIESTEVFDTVKNKWRAFRDEDTIGAPGCSSSCSCHASKMCTAPGSSMPIALWPPLCTRFTVDRD